MELQKYLQKQGLEKLVEDYKIKVNRHQNYPNLVCLKYSQIESPMSEKVVQQCRGIILDEAKNWQIISYAYDKFFNYREPLAVEIDWDTATVYDKLDGSLMVLYYYNDKWQVQSSGAADGSGKVYGFKFSFAQLFWQVWQELNYTLPEEIDYCFSFELLTPYNRIVVQQNKNNLVLHGVRNIKTLQEENPQVLAEKYGFNLVKIFPLSSWQNILKSAEKLEPLEAEGYVICDAKFNRIKIKSPQYVAWAHFSSSFSTRKMIQIILNNEGDELLTYYPEWQELYYQISDRYQELIIEIEEKYEQHKIIPIQKDFAIAIKDLPYSGILFALRADKYSSRKEALVDTSIVKLERLLEIKYIDFRI
ncbi:MAG: T4 RnlA family RNA ligase [Microcoleaceae cyanobacterium]